MMSFFGQTTVVQLKCDLCRRVLSSEEAAADSQLCPDCLRMIMDEKHSSENIIHSFSANRRFVVLWFCLCAIVTAFGSYNVSCPILGAFDFIFAGRSWWLYGYEFECLLSTIPGLLGFFVAFLVFSSKSSPCLRISKSVIVGIVVGCLTILSLHIWDYCVIRFH
jgi:hypothetical protein